MERFNLKKLNSVYVTIKSQNLWNIDDSENISGTFGSIKENILIPCAKNLDFCELKEHKPCFDKICSQFKIRGCKKIVMVSGSETYEWNSVNNVRPEISSHYRNKKKEDLSGKISELLSSAYYMVCWFFINLWTSFKQPFYTYLCHETTWCMCFCALSTL